MQLTRSQLMLDGLLLGRLDGDELDTGNALENLRIRLEQRSELHKKMPGGEPLTGEVLLEVDRNLPFEWVQQVSGACARAGYPHIGFVGVSRQGWTW